jgi:hypothetical protein
MKQFIILLIVGLSITSCEKVIDIDLNTANPQIVVEAELYKGVNDFKVKLSYTSSFFKEEEQDVIEAAVVSLTKNGGETINVPYVGDGIYLVEDFEAGENETFTLDVDSEGVTYSSTAAMPAPAKLDSARAVANTGGPFGPGEGYIVFMYWKDDPDIVNFYRAIYTLNGEEQRTREDVFIFDDSFTNGNETEIPLFVRTFELGDTVDLKFLSVDPKAYDYFLTLNTIIGNGQPSAAPANPNSNFSNGALGYFAVYNGDEKRIIVE